MRLELALNQSKRFGRFESIKNRTYFFLLLTSNCEIKFEHLSKDMTIKSIISQLLFSITS